MTNKLEKLEILVNKINNKRNANRARHLIRVLEKAHNNGNLDVSAFENSNNDFVRGMIHTLDYLSREDKTGFTFDVDFSGWGCYEPITSGNHKGDYVLWFSRLGGDTQASGEGSGWYSEFNDNARASGYRSGWGSTFNGNSQASGYYSGWGSTFNGNSQASGYYSGWYS